jgi:hypothetical protein
MNYNFLYFSLGLISGVILQKIYSLYKKKKLSDKIDSFLYKKMKYYL